MDEQEARREQQSVETQEAMHGQEPVGALATEEEAMPARAYAAFPRRLLGLVIDTVVIMTFFLVGAFAVTASGVQAAGATFMALLVAVVILYDPLLVSRTGGTIGHHALNLRVEHEEGGRLSFLRALLRSWLKALLGLFSFFFMLLTQRHQALHDKLTHSVVVVHDLEKARPEHYLVERPIAPTAAGVSVVRRLLVIAAYWLAIFLTISFFFGAVASTACLDRDVCSPGERLAIDGGGVGIVLLFGLTMVLGWLGRLPGARARRAAEDPPAEGSDGHGTRLDTPAE